MSGIHEIGARGERLLADYLIARGRVVAPSDRKTFDLIVDGRYAEVKTSDSPYAKLGFIGLTDAQYKALRDGTAFSVFVVCNARNPEQLEVLEFDAVELLRQAPKVECTYYWYRKHLDQCRSNASPAAMPDAVPMPSRQAAEMREETAVAGTGLIAHVRRLAASEDAALYIRFARADLARSGIVDRQPVRLALDNGPTIDGVVRLSGSTPWLAPGPGSSNAAITGVLLKSGLGHGADVHATVRSV